MNSERNAPRPLGRGLPQFRVTRLRERYPGTGFPGFKEFRQRIEILSLSSSEFCLAGTTLSKKAGTAPSRPTGAHLHHGHFATQRLPGEQPPTVTPGPRKKDGAVQPWALECSLCPKAERRRKKRRSTLELSDDGRLSSSGPGTRLGKPAVCPVAAELIVAVV
jgi:hypothetical protein